MAIRHSRKTRIRTSHRKAKGKSFLWMFLSLLVMIIVLLSLFFFKKKMGAVVELPNSDELIKQDMNMRNNENYNDTFNGDNIKENNIVKEEYKKEDIDYLNGIIKRK